MEKNNKLLIVDDEERVLSSLKRLLQNEGYEVFTAASGRLGLDILNRETIGVVVSDLMMPEMDGIEFLGKSAAINKDVVQILLTGHASLDTALEAINRLGLFGFTVKPWNNLVLISDINRAFEKYNLVMENKRLFELTEKQNRQLREMNESLEEQVKNRTQLLNEAVDECVLMLARAAEAKDDQAQGHIHRIYNQVFELCKAMDMTNEKAERISLFSMVHDIGKLRISDSILERGSDLTAAEETVRQSHTLLGEEMLGVKPFYKTAREIVRSHHEKWDGSGYPDGLQGEEIPLAARIVAVVDTVEALTHKEPYKEAWDQARVWQELKNIAGSKLDPGIVEIFLKIQSEKKNGRKKNQG
ncbi:MAG: response regulator [Desulfosudaceae bacterium]